MANVREIQIVIDSTRVVVDINVVRHMLVHASDQVVLLGVWYRSKSLTALESLKLRDRGTLSHCLLLVSFLRFGRIKHYKSHLIKVFVELRSDLVNNLSDLKLKCLSCLFDQVHLTNIEER